MKIKNKKGVISLVIAVFLTIAFFTYSVVITHDSSHYLWLSNILGTENFSNWDIIRGFVFPSIIKFSSVFFGSTTNGLKFGMYIGYCMMIFISYLIYKDSVGKEEFVSKKFKIITLIFFIIMIALNPITFGYYHTLLTEFVAITIAIVFCYCAWKWMSVDFFENKIKYILYTIVFSIFTVISWFLKQPYVGVVLFPILIAAFISIITNFNLKNIIQRAVTVMICMVVMVIGMKSWNAILKANNVFMDESRNPAASFGDYVLNLSVSELDRNTYNYVDDSEKTFELEKGGYNFNIDIYESQMNNLTEESKKEINENKGKYKSFIIINNADGYDIIYNKKESASLVNSMFYDIEYFFRHPIKVIARQVKNYLAICNVYRIEFKGSQGTIPVYTNEVLGLTESNENALIPNRIYNYKGENNFYLQEKLYPYAASYIEVNTPVRFINSIMKRWFNVMTILVKACFLLLPFLLLVNVISLIKNIKKYDEKYKKISYLMLILYSYSFMHILAHSLIGSIIDRYTSPAIITAFIAVYINVYLIIYNKNYMQNKMLNDK